MVTNISPNRSAIFGSNVNQLCISASGETFSMLASHLVLQFLHHRRLHRLHIRKPEELPGLERRAVYFNVYLHVRS